jgi:hypothetical protein
MHLYGNAHPIAVFTVFELNADPIYRKWLSHIVSGLSEFTLQLKKLVAAINIVNLLIVLIHTTHTF